MRSLLSKNTFRIFLIVQRHVISRKAKFPKEKKLFQLNKPFTIYSGVRVGINFPSKQIKNIIPPSIN